jgi:cytochrome c6
MTSGKRKWKGSSCVDAFGEHLIWKISMGGSMKYLLLSFLLLAISFPAAAQSGKELFERNCVMCHGDDGSANTQLGKSLGAKDLRANEARKMTDAEIYAVIEKGKNQMPPFGESLKKAEINSIIAYVRELQKK